MSEGFPCSLHLTLWFWIFVYMIPTLFSPNKNHLLLGDTQEADCSPRGWLFQQTLFDLHAKLHNPNKQKSQSRLDPAGFFQLKRDLDFFGSYGCSGRRRWVDVNNSQPSKRPNQSEWWKSISRETFSSSALEPQVLGGEPFHSGRRSSWEKYEMRLGISL